MVVLIAGPPCGGKSRFALDVAGSDQLVLDFDEIVKLHAGCGYSSDPAVLRAARAEWVDRLPSADLVIWTAPRRVDRARFARQYGAQVVLVMASEATCLERAGAERPALWVDYVREWFRDFEPSSRPGAESFVWTDR